jgi:Phenylpropionate dioxygenase and related ring-hydroxylating dioxygenases, large terminal subunit
MFLKSAWYVAGWTDEFEAGQLYARRIIDEPLVLMRREDDTLIALEDRCPHRWAPLSLGRIEDDTIRCMYHGVRFASNGRCIEVPGQTSAPGSLKARIYPVVEQHKWAWVWMGDADRRIRR